MAYLKPQLFRCGWEGDGKLFKNAAFAVCEGIEVRQITSLHRKYSFTSVDLSAKDDNVKDKPNKTTKIFEVTTDEFFKAVVPNQGTQKSF